MKENIISAFGAGLILISFGVIVSFFIASGVEKKAAEENATITFEQFSELSQNTSGKLKSSHVVQEFRKFVGDTMIDLKNKVIIENSTLHSELKNTTSVNGTS